MSDLHSITPSPQPSRTDISDHTGEIFGRLTLVKKLGGRHVKYECMCTCGNSKTVEYSHLHLGHTRSCGCLKADLVTARSTVHGLNKTPEHKAWRDMWLRCTEPSCKDYVRYKDRAPPCEWRDFEVFLAHIGPKPSSKHSLDRIDNDKPYGPGNVRWATSVEQNSNKVNNRKITYLGRTQTITQWARETGTTAHVLFFRIVKQAWPVEKALTTPVRCYAKTRNC